MAAFASLCIPLNPSTVSHRIYSHKSVKSSIPSFNRQKIKTGRQREKICRPVSMSKLLEEGEKQGGGRTGLLERGEIVFPKIVAPPPPVVQTASGGDIGKSEENVAAGGGERYKVLLLDHERHTEKQVAAVLPKVVPSITAEEAKKCFHESRKLGESLVTVAVKEHAEFYAQMMSRCGLRSAIEPDGDVL